MNYTKDFEVFVKINEVDDVLFQEIQRVVLSKDNAYWKDGSKDIISAKNNIALNVSQDDGILRLAYRSIDQVRDNSGDILLSPDEFLLFWEDPEGFFPKLNEEEGDFFKNLSINRNLEDKILTLYSYRTGTSVKRGRQAGDFNAMANRRQISKELCEKQKKYISLLEQKLSEYQK